MLSDICECPNLTGSLLNKMG